MLATSLLPHHFRRYVEIVDHAIPTLVISTKAQEAQYKSIFVNSCACVSICENGFQADIQVIFQ